MSENAAELPQNIKVEREDLTKKSFKIFEAGKLIQSEISETLKTRLTILVAILALAIISTLTTCLMCKIKTIKKVPESY